MLIYLYTYLFVLMYYYVFFHLVDTDTSQMDNDGTVKKFAQNLTGTTTNHVVTHNLGSRDVVVGVYETASTYDEVECVVQRTSINTVTFIFNVAPTSGEYRVVITG